MTILEITLISILWIKISLSLGRKWYKAVEYNLDNPGFVYFLAFTLTPLVLLGAIIRQVFIENWK